MVTRTHVSTVVLTEFGTVVKVIVEAVGCWLKVLVAEHALARRAATLAALPRKRLRHIRTLYIGADSRNEFEE